MQFFIIMSSPDKPHFSNTILDLSECAQHGLRHTQLGGEVVRFFVGSKSPAYRQLDWRSQNVHAKVQKTVRVPGDPEAGWLARNWHRAMIMATTVTSLSALKDEYSSTPFEEAVAYVSDGTVHVGTNPSEDALLQSLTQNEWAVAMRIGRKPHESTIGLWLPGERTFVSVPDLRVVEPAISLKSLEVDYPDVRTA